MAMDELEKEFMFLADGATVENGKLYVLGGGWSHLFVESFPGRSALPVAIVVGLKVPYSLTNRRFQFVLRVVDADGQTIEEPASGEFEMGRPAGLRQGASQRFMLSGLMHPEFPSVGRYLVQAVIDGDVVAETWLEVGEAASQQTA